LPSGLAACSGIGGGDASQAAETGFGVPGQHQTEVAAELEAQQAAAEEAEKAARKAIRDQKRQERKETAQQRVEALRSRFHKQ
jgi:hypothetical protein